MRSTDYSSSPPEGNYIDVITDGFELRCDNYAFAYTFSKFLSLIPTCDFSQILDDFWLAENGVPQSDWVIFFTCIPKDAVRLCNVARHIPYNGNSIIVNSKGEVMWEK